MLHVLSDLRFQTRAFGELFVKVRGQSSHLVSKGVVVIFAFFRANVSPRCQNIIVFLNLFQFHGAAEARRVYIIRVLAENEREKGKKDLLALASEQRAA
jgi:hypothetical protein